MSYSGPSSFWWLIFFFFKQKTAYEMRISDWSSDVCSSDLNLRQLASQRAGIVRFEKIAALPVHQEFPMAADVRSHHDRTLRHRLQRLQGGNQVGEPHAVAWIDEERHQVVVAAHLLVRHPPGEDDLIADTQPVDLGNQALLLRPSADHQKLHSLPFAKEAHHRLHQELQPLVSVEGADEAEHDAAFQAQRTLQGGVDAPLGGEAFGVHGIGHHGHLARLDAAAEDDVLQALADGDDGIRMAQAVGFQEPRVDRKSTRLNSSPQ